MSQKLIKEYNDRQALAIATFRKRNGRFVNKARIKVLKLADIKSAQNKVAAATGSLKINAQNKLDTKIDNKIDQIISNKYIRTYRTIIDNLFVGGEVDSKLTSLTYLRDKVRAPGSKDGRLLPKSVAPGMFYIFKYDPKGKADLDYYDKLPLVLILSLHKNGFTGLNLHLIDTESRLRIYNLMLMFKRGVRYRTHMKIVWDIIKRVDRFRMGRPIVRRYLYSNVRSKFSRIPVDDWEIMLLLPTIRFVGMQANTVFKENKKKAFRS